MWPILVLPQEDHLTQIPHTLVLLFFIVADNCKVQIICIIQLYTTMVNNKNNVCGICGKWFA